MNNNIIANFRKSYGLPIGVLIFTLIALTLHDTAFFSTAGLYGTLQGFEFVGIVAVGVGVTMIAGELDLSAASLAVLSAVIAFQIQSIGLVPSIIVATLIVGVIGVIQGWIIAKLNINSLVFTVATLLLIQGAAWLVAGGGQAINLKDFAMSDPLLNRWWVFTPGILVSFLVFVLVGLFLGFVRWGREIYAIGGARTEARAAGASVTRSIVIAFTVSALCAGLAGAMQAMKSGSADPKAFQEVVLASVAASLVGGISLHGGRGTVFNIALGVATIGAVATLPARQVPNYWVQLLTGVLLFIVIAIEWLNGWNERRAERVEFRRHIDHHTDEQFPDTVVTA